MHATSLREKDCCWVTLTGSKLRPSTQPTGPTHLKWGVWGGWEVWGVWGEKDT
ncbi:MAG: hypothetical protein QNJ74_21645 [Trichodesmium sp. MO_231.B1]|nr:hypothetical protein [Trichodesmium sp. MO_231.B1]